MSNTMCYQGIGALSEQRGIREMTRGTWEKGNDSPAKAATELKKIQLGQRVPDVFLNHCSLEEESHIDRRERLAFYLNSSISISWPRYGMSHCRHLTACERQANLQNTSCKPSVRYDPNQQSIGSECLYGER